ncbi:MAG TPA: hypothetical protein VG944_06495, partial [Fimbriimonas sp.]|nr:hypothetical protein [Fimbriimonas sp.]
MSEAENPIVVENVKPGTTDWLLNSIEPRVGTTVEELCVHRPAIEAYCSHASINASETLSVFVSTDPPSPFTVDLYRMGYYGGTGGR